MNYYRKSLRQRVEILEKNSNKVMLWDFPSDGLTGEFPIDDLLADILKRLTALEKKE